ncbi:PvrR [Paramagnetospirillum magneticum AMB-1]|uniref:PvrR n=2 Tax=Paramagnetospirillum magneticum TaxID=84159 RepID=Q2W209_PARM1|nr:PvrR [Paramagnetospirillum magneticum AMB-1]
MTDLAKADQPRVLILDDERDMCEFVADVGDDQGFNAQWCDNFEDFACRYSIDLRGIFLDLAMPGVDGIEIIRFLGDNNSKAHLVLMSGHDIHLLEAARRLAESRGLKVAGVLHKPFELSALVGLYDQLAAITAPQCPTTSARPGSQYVPTASDLDAALAAGHIIPFYQPKLSVSTRAITGVEVLARWRHPDHGLVGPDYFIPLAEKEGLIERLTDQIIDQSLVQGRIWLDQGRPLKLALNLSALSLRHLDLPEDLLRRVEGRGLSPEQIVLEITESALASDFSASLDILTRLRMRRFALSIDDFGTGYSSLKQLQHGPFTELKIDQSFIAKALEEEGSLAIVESSVQLGRRMGLKVVAEGIETEQQMDLIRHLGCDEAQGYLLGRPVAANDFPR